MTEEKIIKINQVVNIFKNQIYDENYNDFLNVLLNIGFFNNISDSDIDWNLAIESKKYGPSLSTLKYNKVALGIDIQEGKAFVGIDPSTCFDSIKRASIHAVFPMKRREYKRFMQLFNQLLDLKSSFRKEWIKEAPYCFYGQYAQFGI